MFDTLTFPDTMEEFIEQYKVIKGENLYCDGVEFIPVFRMKEWVEHLQPQKGKWIYYDPNGFKCSRCGRHLEIECGDVKMNFCPHCGTDMRDKHNE